MSPAARFIVAMWLLAIAIVSYGALRDNPGEPPAPHGYTGAALVYGLLMLASAIPGAGAAAGVFAASWTFSLYLRVQGIPITATRTTPTRKAAAR